MPLDSHDEIHRHAGVISAVKPLHPHWANPRISRLAEITVLEGLER